MSLVLNTNIDSTIAQNNLNTSQALLTQSLTRLSSGLRINSAADDAAGLAIAQQFTTQVNGTNQAINNANDAVSEAQTTAGALTTITNNLQSIRTLAVEAANGSNSASDRQALDQQVQQQIAEISQIASQTTFNGLNVLNGTSGETTYQVGANVGDTISVDLAQGVGANQIGAVANSVGEVTNAATAGGLTIAVGNNTAVTVQSSSLFATTASSGEGTAAYAYQDGASAYAKAAAINGSDISGLTATASNSQDVTVGPVTVGTGGYSLAINGVTVENATGGSLSVADLVSAINSYSTQDGGVTAATGGSGIILTAADGSNIQLNQNLNVAGGTATASTGGITAVASYNAAAGADIGTAAAYTTGAQAFYGQVSLSASQNIELGGTTADLAASGYAAATTVTATGTLQGNNVLTVTGANATIESVDSALETVSQFQSQLGAIQNRFTAAVSNLQTTSQNLTQSRSTIEDADFAQETANLTQAQVLEQAGISVLAQANQQPQLILKLLS
jgi:flagellin